MKLYLQSALIIFASTTISPTPLHHAIKNGSLAEVKKILCTNIDPNKTSQDISPLHLAAAYHRFDMTRELLIAGAVPQMIVHTPGIHCVSRPNSYRIKCKRSEEIAKLLIVFSGLYIYELSINSSIYRRLWLQRVWLIAECKKTINHHPTARDLIDFVEQQYELLPHTKTINNSTQFPLDLIKLIESYSSIVDKCECIYEARQIHKIPSSPKNKPGCCVIS